MLTLYLMIRSWVRSIVTIFVPPVGRIVERLEASKLRIKLLENDNEALKDRIASLEGDIATLSAGVEGPEAVVASEGGRIKVSRPASKEEFIIRPEEFDDFVFKTGDDLTVIPEETAKTMHVTPDGSLHVPVQGGKAIRVPQKIEMFSFRGFEIPEHLILLTGAGGETLEPIGTKHVANYQKFMGLEADMTILEIGCGIGRDALQLINKIGPEGRYVGIDVTHGSINWCQKNIGSRYPNFQFHHFDAKHELYNPLGSKTTLDFQLPVENNTVDRVALGSVFTHLFEEEILHYMKEIARVLKPSGLAYATFFLYSEETIKAARTANLTHANLRFEHAFGGGSYVNDPAYPTGAIAYTDEVMCRMIKTAGLRQKGPFLKGYWSGAYEHSDDGQEVAILAPRD